MRRLIHIAVLACFLWVIPAWSACTSPCVQIKSAFNAGSGDTLDVSFNSNNTSGNAASLAIIFCTDAGCGASVSGYTWTITDTNMNTYDIVEDNAGINPGFRLNVYLASNIGAGANTIHIAKASGGSTAVYLTAVVVEWGLVAASPFDASGNGSGTSTTPSATSGVTVQANEIVYGVAGGGNALTAGMGYSLLSDQAGPLLMSDEFKTVSSTGAQTASFTMSSASWEAAVITLKYTPAGGGSGAKRCLLLGVCE